MATDDDELAARVRCLKFHGLGVDAFDRQVQGRKPQAEVVEPGFKYNLSDIHAAIAVVQLSRVEQLNARRAALATRYREALNDSPLQLLSVPDYPHIHANHLLMVRVDKDRCGIDRDSFMEKLKEKILGPDYISVLLILKNIIVSVILNCHYRILNGIQQHYVRCHCSQI